MTEREIFAEALARPAADRPAFLDQECGPDGVLRRRLERLLALHGGDFPLLDRPAPELTPSPAAGVPAELGTFLGPAARPGAVGRLGHYDLLELVGRGGCGIVFRALDDKLNRVVAVKVLAPLLAVTSPPRQRFLREARAAARVRDEHVVQVYAVEEEPIPHLVTEFVPGESLQQRLDRIGPRPASEAILVGRQVALGLAAAHEQGLIHRDVKPANILLDDAPEPRAKLTDFGLARAADDASLTQSGVLAGTPMFMSPEQARGGEVLDHRTDLFSLGSVLYTVVAGRPPFRAASALAVLKRVAEEAPRPLREVIADVPPGLVEVIERLMAKDPADRFPTARDAAAALDVCLTVRPRTVPRNRLRRAAAAILLTVAAATGAVWHLTRPPVVADLPPVGPVAVQPPTPQPAADPVPANALVVTGTADDDTPGTLRWAVEQANARPGADTIVFDPAAFATAQTIFLTRGELRLSDTAPTTVLGPAAGVTVSGKRNEGQRAFRIHSTDGGGSPAVATIRSLVIVDCDLGTGAGQQGAGVLVGNADVVLDRVTVAGCFCNFGGGVLNFGALRVINSTFTRNAATNGGAILNSGILTVVNSTFSGNRASGAGAGIMATAGSVKVVCSTLTANIAENHGGAVTIDGEGVSVTLANTVSAGNKGGAAPDLSGAFTATNCLIGSTAGATLLPESARNITGESPRLGPLGNNGGPTETHAPLPDSPALDAGDGNSVPANLRTDQRGKPRVSGPAVDIGAVERE